MLATRFIHVICYLLTFLSQAQQSELIVNHRMLSVEDGLSSREVLCGLQDARGFIWLGTRNGICRYDGSKFLPLGKKNGLRHDRIVQLIEDEKGYLWICYGKDPSNRSLMGAVDILNTRTMEIVSLSEHIKIPFAEEDILWITANEKNEIAIVVKPFTIYRYNVTRGLVKLGNVESAFRNYGEPLYFSGNEYLYTHKTPVRIIANEAPQFINKKVNLFLLGKDQNGNWLALTQEILGLGSPVKYGCAVIDKNGAAINSNFLDNTCWKEIKRGAENKVHVFYDVKTNSSIISFGQDFYHFKDNRFEQLLSAAQLDNTISINGCSHFSDRQGQHWLTTNNGVFIIHKAENKFEHYFTRKQVQPEDTKDNQVRGIYADTVGSIYATVWQHLLYQKKNSPIRYMKLNSSSLALARWNDQLIIGNFQLQRFDITKGELISTNNDFGFQWFIPSMDSGQLILRKKERLGTYNVKKNIFNTCKTADSSHAYTIYRVFRGNDNKIYTAGNNGIWVVDERGCITERFHKDAVDSLHRIPDDNLFWAFEDAHGIFWLLTQSDGLYRWNRRENTFTHLTVSEGLSSNVLYCMLQDRFGFLWISSDMGLMRMDTANFSTQVFTTEDGITHNEFNRISCFIADDGKMYFGGMDGITGLNPANFSKRAVKYNVPLEVIAFNQYIAKQSAMVELTNDFALTNRIVMQPGDDFFTIEFALLDFSTKATQYAYKLEGLDKDWNYISTNILRMNNLPYGDYRLLIKGQNKKGYWSTSILKIPVSVITPFYRQTWFYMLVVVIAMLLVYGIFFWRTSWLRKSNSRLTREVSLRTHELKQSLDQKEMLLKEIHHRVKNNLQVIGSLLDLQSHDMVDEKAKTALDESKNRVASISIIHHQLYQHDLFSAVDLKKFTSELVQQVSSVFKKTEQEVEVNMQIRETLLDIDTCLPLGLIMNEMLTNSYKYAFTIAKKGCIHISLERSNMEDGTENLILIYRDNGAGLPADLDMEKVQSLGLRLITRLSKQIKGRTEYNNNDGAEFRVHFKYTIPIHG